GTAASRAAVTGHAEGEERPVESKLSERTQVQLLPCPHGWTVNRAHGSGERSARGCRPPRNNSSSKSGLACTMRIKADKLCRVVPFRPWKLRTDRAPEAVKVARRSTR